MKKKKLNKKLKYQVKLHIYRKKIGMTQKDMAKFLDINVRTYHFKEKGLQEFKGSELYKLAKLFGVTIEELFIFEFEDEFEDGRNENEVNSCEEKMMA
ncbi:helix-turn-helix transcriptional regulator [Lysinibacillus sp. 1P01SD]|uniref:helix-turn-helix transcriptional regulator n=1 Tax=Lysinibacillus sp. 1P01SD TaxID=3132285 RepID=UPI0039A19D22